MLTEAWVSLQTSASRVRWLSYSMTAVIVIRSSGRLAVAVTCQPSTTAHTHLPTTAPSTDQPATGCKYTPRGRTMASYWPTTAGHRTSYTTRVSYAQFNVSCTGCHKIYQFRVQAEHYVFSKFFFLVFPFRTSHLCSLRQSSQITDQLES